MRTHGRPTSTRRRVIVVVAALAVLVAASVTALVLRSQPPHTHTPQGLSSSTSSPSSSASTSPSATPTPQLGPFSPGDGPAIPASGALVGAYVPAQGDLAANKVSSFNRFETLSGTDLAIAHLYTTWSQSFGDAAELSFIGQSKDLLLSWAGTDTIRIADGKEDSTIIAAANAIAKLPAKVFLEFRWEMDRPNLKSVVHSPQDFIAAWDHIRAIFTQHHVNNVAWVWCPLAAGFDAGRAAAYYPGDDEVDWICADVYPLHAYDKGTFEPFATLMTSFMEWADGHDKPIMIGEFGVNASYGSRRAEWLNGVATYVKSQPQIKALVYFDQTTPGTDGNSLDNDPSALGAFTQLANSSYFNGG